MKQDTSNTAQALWIGIGSFCSFLFSIVSSAILSRYLAKDAYGTYKQIMYVYTTLLSVFTLGLPLAYSYFLPRVSKNKGKSLCSKLDRAFLILGAIFSLSLFYGSNLFASILNNPSLAHCIRIFSPVPLFILPTMGLQGVLATYKLTIWNAIYVVSTRILMLLFVALPVVFYNATCETAIHGFVIASFLSLIIAFIIEKIPFKGVNKEPCDITYKDIFSYSIPLMLAGLLGIGIKAADQFYVSRFFGQEVFADFANGSLELPFVGMVLSAGATVLLPQFSRMLSAGEPSISIVDIWKRTAVKSALIIYPLVAFFWFFAKDTMLFLYGNNYILSAVYFRIMLFVNFFTVIPFYPIILALGKTKEYAFNHVIVFFIVWFLEYISVRTIHSAYAITAVSAICRLSLIVIMFRLVAKSIHIPMTSLLPIRELTKVFLSVSFSGFISWYLVGQMTFLHIKFASLVVGFILFAIITLLLGKILVIDYFSIVRPMFTKQREK